MKSATHTTVFRLVPLCAALLAAFPLAVEAGIAGRFQFVAGDVRVIDASGKERTAKKGDSLNEGESVLSALNASAQVKMIDGGFMAIRPDSHVKVDVYQYAGKEDGAEKGLFSIIKGGFRAITGAIGRTNKENYKIATPSATIGIRGTDHEPMVVLPPQPGVVARVPAGTYDKVNVGGAYLENSQGIADAGPNKVVYAAGSDVKPTLLPTIPPIYMTTPTVGDKGAKKEEDKKEQKPAEWASAATPTSDATATTNAIINQVAEALGMAKNKPAYTPGAFVATGFSGYYADTTSLPSTWLNSPYFSDSGAGLTVARNASGHVTGYSYNGDGISWSQSVSFTGGSAADFGQNATTDMSWGRWVGGKVNQSYNDKYWDITTNSWTTYSGQSWYELGSGSAHWITGKEANPGYLGMALTGSATYTKIGGTQPTDNYGNVGTLNSASLNVNFTTQTANVGVNFTVAGTTWGMAASPVLWGGKQFYAYSCNGCATPYSSALTGLTKNGQGVLNNQDIWWGFMDGELLGTGLNSAALRYHVGESIPATGTTSSTWVEKAYDGVVAFSGPTQSTQAPYRAVMLMNLDYWYGYGTVAGTYLLDDFYNYNTWGTGRAIAPATSVVTDGEGALQSFTMQGVNYQEPGAVSTWTDQVVKIAQGTAIAKDVGMDAATGISWGRWEGGALNVSSLTGTALGTLPNTRNIHWVASGTMTAPPTLPLTGTYAYNLVGNTSPTDSQGHVGTLQALTINANFSSMTVDAVAKVAINAQDWNLNATGMPIKGAEFIGISGMTSVPVTVNCTGCATGATVSGGIGGQFIGAGAPAVGVGYRMVENLTATSIGNVITGVAVMKR